MKLNIQQFSALAEGLYDAALHQERWPSVLKELSKVFGACFAGFGWEDTRVMAVGGSHGTEKREGEERKRYREIYRRTLVYSNPIRVPVLLTKNVDDVYTIGTIISTEEYHNSLYYRDYIKPMGWDDGLSNILSKEDGVVHFLAFARKIGDPPFDDDDVESLKLLAPHIRRAYTIGNLIGKQKSQIAALAETFDGLSAAVFLLGEGMRVVYLNERARALLARGEPLAVVNDALRTVDGDMRVGFHEAFRLATQSQGFSGPEGASFVLNAKSESACAAHFMPLTADRGPKVGGSATALAAVFVVKAGLETRSPIELISRAFGLTPREMSVLVAIVELGGAPEVAAQLGLTANTVRSHLKAIFEKTGVTRQAGLVKLVAGYVNPTKIAANDVVPLGGTGA